jgi:Helix-turn-helix domain
MANILKIKTKRRRKRLIAREASKTHKTFEVRDLREHEWFTVDNAFLDGKWARLLKGAPAVVYLALCRHADRNQISFPSVQYLMDESGYGKRQVTRAIRLLEFHRFVKVEREQGEHNIYSLINRKHWRKAIVVTRYLSQ